MHLYFSTTFCRLFTWLRSTPSPNNNFHDSFQQAKPLRRVHIPDQFCLNYYCSEQGTPVGVLSIGTPRNWHLANSASQARSEVKSGAVQSDEASEGTLIQETSVSGREIIEKAYGCLFCCFHELRYTDQKTLCLSSLLYLQHITIIRT